MPIETLRTVADVIGVYLAHLQKRLAAGDFSPHAYEDAARDLKRFVSVYGQRLLSECRRYDLTEWLESNPQWRSAWTRRRILQIIVRPFLWAVAEELIPASPYKVPRMKRGRPRRPATSTEYVILMRRASRPLRRALFFLRRTGARTKEMRELIWAEIDFERGVIVILEHKTVRQQSDPLPRIIGLDRATLRFLRNLRRQAPNSQVRVFVNCEGRPWDRHTFARHMNRWATRLGLEPTKAKLSPYCFRHSYGTNAIEAGVGEKQLADQMGHSSTKMISYYAQTAGKIEHLKRVAEDALKRRRNP